MILLLFGLLCNTGSAAPHEVTTLPGWTGPLPSKAYTGFVEVEPTEGNTLFYYFVESENDPGNDPLIWWFNGGPGASSLVGLFEAVGPLLLNEESALVNNPFAWTKFANMLFVEFAPGVGYSYCNGSSTGGNDCEQANPTCSPCLADDDSTAEQNALFLEKFLTHEFPSLAGRELILAGESYSGVYMPTLARELFRRHRDTSLVNLVALWNTDPCTSNEGQFGRLNFSPDFAVEKGLINDQTWELLTDDCQNGRDAVGDYVRDVSNDLCRNAWRVYDLAFRSLGDAIFAPDYNIPMYIDPTHAYGPAGGTDLEGYLGSEEMRASLNVGQSPNSVYHVELNNNGYRGYTSLYAACNLDPQIDETMADVYGELLEATKTGGSAANFRRLVLSTGDLDSVVNPRGTERSVFEIPNVTTKTLGQRRPWFFEQRPVPLNLIKVKPAKFGQFLNTRALGPQIGGFALDFDTGTQVELTFMTVRASGHATPMYTPQRLFQAVLRTVVGSSPLAPPLPEGFASMDDRAYYGENGSEGAFATWVNEARGAATAEAENLPPLEQSWFDTTLGAFVRPVQQSGLNVCPNVCMQ